MSQRIPEVDTAVSFLLATPDQRDALIAFIAADSYPFNGVPAPTEKDVASWIDKGIYTETFWIVLGGTTRVGVMQYQDASAIHAEIHIRLHAPYRGRGIGTQAVGWLTDYLFQTFLAKHRVEGWTRADNIAMRRVFRACGYIRRPICASTSQRAMGRIGIRSATQSCATIGGHKQSRQSSGTMKGNETVD